MIQRNDKEKQTDATHIDAFGVHISHRHASWVISGTLGACFCIFISGYFIGKHKAFTNRRNELQEGSFADRMYYSMSSLYTNQETQEERSGAEVEKESSGTAGPELAMAAAVNEEMPNAVTIQSTDRYQAELIGFGNLSAAEKFASRLAKRNIAVLVKKRTSTTAKGRTLNWYQVVTDIFSNKEQLEALVETLTKVEKLKGVTITKCA